MIRIGTLQAIGIPLFFLGTLALSATDAPEGASSRAVAGKVPEVTTEAAPGVNKASAPAERREWLSSASLEELMQVRVTSAARKEQSLADVPAAMFVVTQDDIRRSGANSVPEALRMVPGLHVAQVSASSWAISARGFTGRFANKMLVLVDGRSVYTNLYSGVYWEQNDLLMEDIERIEVIRGPGATMWGANAVNGVINIITRSTEQTQGALVSLQSGITEPYMAALRYGGKAGETFHYRLYGKAYSRGPQLNSLRGGVGDANDVWRGNQFGMRSDWTPNDRDTLTVQANVYRSRAGQTFDLDFPARNLGATLADRVRFNGGMGLLRWKREVSAKSDFALQASYSKENRDEYVGRGRMETYDFDFQHRYRMSERHDLMWGAGYRLYRDEIRGSASVGGEDQVRFVPPSANDGISTTFVQDEIALLPKRLSLTVGTKLQHNPYTGVEIQPNARLLWTPSERTSIWGAVSRAVRTPSRRDLAVEILFAAPQPAPPGSVIRLTGRPDSPSETSRSFEAGVRKQFGGTFSLDVAAFQADYGKLQGSLMGDPMFEFAPRPRLIFPSTYTYDDTATHRGVEISAAWAPHYSWKLLANYSYMHMQSSRERFGSQGFGGFTYPSNQAQLRSSWDLTTRLSLDAFAYRVSDLAESGVPGYWRADLRLGWKASEDLELSLAGQNLTDARHLEFISEDFVRSSYLRRNVSLRLLWSW